MRTILATLLFNLGGRFERLSRLVCDHKAVQSASMNDYLSTYCWSCGAVGVEKK